ncbi:MAG: sporulation protein YabP [Bacillales bacterium]|nr:sporulation protein YabP [Bacillales bacterium]
MDENIVRIVDRKKCEVKGVLKIDSFDSKEFLISTKAGYLHVKGKNLALGEMNTNEGVLTIDGDIDSATYLNKSTNGQKEDSFLKKLFK